MPFYIKLPTHLSVSGKIYGSCFPYGDLKVLVTWSRDLQSLLNKVRHYKESSTQKVGPRIPTSDVGGLALTPLSHKALLEREAVAPPHGPH